MNKSSFPKDSDRDCDYSPHRKPLFPQESTVLRFKHHVSEENTRRLLRESEDDETPQRAIFASEEAHREPEESVVYFRSGILCRSLYRLVSKTTNLFSGTSNQSQRDFRYSNISLFIW